MTASALHRVTLLGADGSSVSFDAAPGRSIARAAAAAGLILTTGCLQGRCAICRARLVAGQVVALRRPSPNAKGNPARRDDGCVLPCSVGPLSEVVLEPLSPWHEVPSRA